LCVEYGDLSAWRQSCRVFCSRVDSNTIAIRHVNKTRDKTGARPTSLRILHTKQDLHSGRSEGETSQCLMSHATRGSKIFGNGQKQPHLKLCLLKASHEQVIKSILFCLLILMWLRDRPFKFDPPGSNFG